MSRVYPADRVHTLIRHPRVGDVIVTADQDALWTVTGVHYGTSYTNRQVDRITVVETATGQHPRTLGPHEAHVVSRGDVTRLTRHGIPTRWQVSP